MSVPPPRPLGTPALHDTDGDLSLRFEDGTVQSRLRPTDPARLLLEYTRLMLGFVLLHPAPERIAMIGLGGGALARYCALKLPAADFTAIEISPEVIALRDACGVPPDGPRFRVLCEDGAAFVRRDGDPFDVLLVDGFDRGGQPDDLCSAAFYDACRDRLAAGGLLVVNLYVDEATDGRVDRLRTAFDERLVAVVADDTDNTVVFAAADPPFPPPFPELVQRLRACGSHHPVALDVTLRKIVQYRGRRRAPSTQRRLRTLDGRRATMRQP